MGHVPRSHPTALSKSVIVSFMLVYAIIDVRSSSDHPLGDAIETFIRRKDAERFAEATGAAAVIYSRRYASCLRRRPMEGRGRPSRDQSWIRSNGAGGIS